MDFTLQHISNKTITVVLFFGLASLNQANAGLWPARAWFLIITFVHECMHVCVYACVCVCMYAPETINN